MEIRSMKAEKLAVNKIEWQPALEVFGERVFYDGQPLVENKVLSDRRSDGAGVAYIVKFRPPKGKILKVVATARSDEHVYLLEGAHCNRAGEAIASPGTYGINPAGRPHSAFVATETTALVVYRGEPDEVHELEVVEPVAHG
jgi:hypothetical protein